MDKYQWQLDYLHATRTHDIFGWRVPVKRTCSHCEGYYHGPRCRDVPCTLVLKAKGQARVD